MEQHDRHRRTWEHCTEMVVFLGSAALAAVAVLPGMGVPGWMIPAIEITAGVAVSLSVWSHTGRGPLAAFCFWFGTCLGGWTVWAEVTGVWHSLVIATWIIGLIICAPAAAHAALSGVPREAPLPALPQNPDAEAERRAEMARFEHMFREAGCGTIADPVAVTELRETRSGRELRLQLPRSGKVTRDALEAAVKQMEVVLRVRPGHITFQTMDHSADVLMRIREKDVFAASATLREEFRARTVNDPFAIGIQEDGKLLHIRLRELHLFIVGTTGMGKSNLLNVIMSQLSYMNDTIIWVIDMKGGRTVKPFIQAWAEGRAERPALDWVATTREEAALMMEAFRGAIDTRMNSGLGSGKIKPSPSCPQIILVCDEMAEIFGDSRGFRKDVGDEGVTNAQFSKMAVSSVDKARSEGCTSVWATQRGTQSMAGSSDLKQLCRLRIALGASTEGDLQYVIPDAKMAKKELTIMGTIPGMGVAAVGSDASLLSKFFLHDHIEDQCGTGRYEEIGCVPACPVYRTGIEVGSIRPPLDRMTARALGETYASRWERAADQPALARLLGHGQGTALLERAEDTVDIAQFEAIVSGVPDPEEEEHPVRRRYREILAARKEMGATPQQLRDILEAEGFTEGTDYDRSTLQRWFRKDEDRGLVHQATFGRWKIGRKREDSAA